MGLPALDSAFFAVDDSVRCHVGWEERSEVSPTFAAAHFMLLDLTTMVYPDEATAG